MKQAKIELGMQFENDTVYVAEREKYEFYIPDGTEYEANKIDINVRSKFEKFPVAFCVCGKKNITLDFRGATLFLHGKMQPFVFEDCENVTVKNVVVEFDRSGFSEMVVLEKGEKHFRARMKERFPYEIIDGNIEFVAPYWRTGDLNKVIHFMQEFDKDTREGAGMFLATVGKEWELEDRPWKNQTFCLHVKQEGDDLIFYGDRVPPFHEGNTVVYGHENRSCSSFATVNCKNVHIENYRILNGCGMGIQPIYTENIYINNFQCFMDERSHGFIANSADAIHAVACFGDFVVENSVVQGMIDDALNVHSHFYRVEKVNGEEITALNLTQIKNTNKIFGVGDEIKFFRGSTRNEVGTAQIKEISILPKEKILLKVAGDLKGVQENDVIEDVSTVCNLVLRNCRFDKANSHLRIQTNTALIENCDISLHCMLTGDAVYWYESAPVKHCVFRNCRFVGERGNISTRPEIESTETAPFYHGHLQVENCTFESEDLVYGSKTEKITLKNNRNTLGKSMRVFVKNCGEIEAQPEVKVFRE